MAAFQPTLAPPGRLVRLGVVLDARNPGRRLAEVARMCDRAGIGAVWVDDSAPPGLPPPAEDALARLLAVTPAVARARLGAMVAPARRPAERLRELAAELGDRLELTLLAGGEPVPAGDPQTGAGWPTAGDGALADAEGLLGALDGADGARPTVAVEVGDPERLSRDRLAWLARVADDLLVAAADVDRVAEQARELRAAFALVGRDPDSLGVAVRLPVSIGRTVAEAAARWDAEPAFAALGPPAQAGVFGTLEHCHERVIALAHAGVTDLRCVLPNAPDVHDVIAQATAMTAGTVAKLAPGAPRSPAPPPPEGWGGRSRFPRP
jgi:alkanesulfonate monooxygenase SsuD/methylene tetrahydromethanopterin reductase-like flavin-dependent oxidoreductase (luciferase family)